MKHAEILVFAKAPLAGQVKTRLIPLLGEQGAADLYLRLLRHTLAWSAHAMPGAVSLCCAPDCEHAFFRHAAVEFGLRLRPQQGADLGQRMAHALGESLERHRYSLLIGADCPLMDGEYARQALHALRAGADVALGPAEDGGYVAIATREPRPDLFRDMLWGEAHVAQVTRERIQALGLRCHELPTLWDVDRAEDVRRLESVPGFDFSALAASPA